jgi:uncharacterized protein (TIGR02246 family)
MTASTPFGALLCLLAALVAPQAPRGASTGEFGQLEQRLAEAWLHGDRAFVDSLLTDDWTVIDYLGHVRTKRDVLSMLGPGGPTFTKMEIDVDNVRLLGDVAVVTGRSLSAGRVGDNDVSIVQRYTDVYVRRDGRWRVAASHGTQVQ